MNAERTQKEFFDFSASCALDSVLFVMVIAWFECVSASSVMRSGEKTITSVPRSIMQATPAGGVVKRLDKDQPWADDDAALAFS
jgi:hypothetical protein